MIEFATKEKNKNIDNKIKEMIKYHSKAKYGYKLPLVTQIAKNFNPFDDRDRFIFFDRARHVQKTINAKKIISNL